ncbi:MAG: PAS domain S-box protein [Bacteroidetes bacterium]|nr:PAS domain S-box protein [Bacteroidota bacterium]
MAAKRSVADNNSLTSLEQEYRDFITALPYPYAIFVNRKLVIKNDLFTRLFPWTQENSPSLSDFFGRKNADLLKEISSLFESKETHGRISTREVLLPAPDRKTVAVELSASVVQFHGKEALYCTFTDVSERRRILDRAGAVDAKFQVLLEGSPLAISVSLDGKFVLLNSSFARMFGYDSVMELLGKSVTSVVSGRNARALIADQEEKRSIGDESDLLYEYTGTKKDGSKIFIEVSARRILFNERWAVLSYHRDMTQQRTTEELFERRSKGLELLNRISDDIAGLSTLDDIYRSGLNAAMRGTQFETGAVLSVDPAHSELRIHTHRNLGGKVVSAFTTQHLDEGLARFFDKTHEPIVAAVSEYPPYLPHRGLFEGERYTSVAFLPLVVRNRLHGILFLATMRQESLDAHDRVLLASLSRQLSTGVDKVLLEETARDANERFAAAVSNISDVLYTLQPDGTFVYVSPSIAKLLGYIPADFMANAGLWRTLLHPDDRPVLSKRISNQATEEEEFQLQYRIFPKGKATYIWLEDRVRYKKASDGSILLIEGILHDITARKQIASEESETPDTRLTASPIEDILHALTDGIAAFDNDLLCTEWNRGLEHITGISRNDVAGKSLHDIPVLRESILAMMDRLSSSENGVTQQVDLSSSLPDVHAPFHLHLKPLLDSQNVRTGVLLLVTRGVDTHQRELDVTESEETLRNVIDAMGDALLISDLEGEIWEVNREFTRLTGYEREEVRLKHFPYPWLLDDEMTRFLRWVSDLHVREHLHDLDMTWVHKNGNQVAVSLNTTLLRNVHGESIAILNIARDISERRQLVLDLEWKNRQFELLNRIISHANTTTDLDQIFESIATEVHALIPFDGMSIAFLDETQQLSPWYHAVPTESGESRRVDRLALDATVIYDAIRSERPVIVSASESRSKSQITIPLFVNEKALGTFSLLSDLKDAFSEDELSVLQPRCSTGGYHHSTCTIVQTG